VLALRRSAGRTATRSSRMPPSASRPSCKSAVVRHRAVACIRPPLRPVRLPASGRRRTAPGRRARSPSGQGRGRRSTRSRRAPTGQGAAHATRSPSTLPSSAVQPTSRHATDSHRVPLTGHVRLLTTNHRQIVGPRPRRTLRSGGVSRVDDADLAHSARRAGVAAPGLGDRPRTWVEVDQLIAGARAELVEHPHREPRRLHPDQRAGEGAVATRVGQRVADGPRPIDGELAAAVDDQRLPRADRPLRFGHPRRAVPRAHANPAA